MNKTRTLAALAILLLAAGLIAACGGDEKEDYAKEVESVLEPLGTELQSLGGALSAATDEAGLVEGLDAAESEIETAVSELEAIDVPSDVEQVNDDLITAIGGFGDELAKVRDAAESGNAADLQTLALGLPQVAEAFQTELSRIQDAAIEAGVPIEDSGN
jgi:hypothetical protein